MTKNKYEFIRPDAELRAHASSMYELLGHNPKSHLPDGGLPARKIQGKWVWVTPRADTPRGKHRVMTECPTCGKVVQAGKLFMHGRIHNDG